MSPLESQNKYYHSPSTVASRALQRMRSGSIQAGALGDQLVLGLIPDSEILRCKGPPVMSEAERKTMVESVKWVGEVITGIPAPVLYAGNI